MIKKTIALLVALSFVFSNIVFADIQKPAALDAKKPVEITTDPEKIIVPRDYGLVKSRYTSKDPKKLIVHIQDAHCNYEAQSNIIKILECLIKNDGLGLISVEGADGFIDTSWFKAFPDADIRKEVADYFMKKGEITGPEFLSITSDYPVKLFGAETRSYYIENLNAFTSSYPLKEDTERYFNQIKAIINKLKNYIYSEELKELDEKNQDYESKKLSFTDYVKYLESLGQKHRIALRQYENLFKLVSVLVYEKKIDFSVVDKERASLIDFITKKLDKEQLTDLVNKSLEFKVGKIASAEYYSYLRDLATKHGVSLSDEYPNLFNYIIYNSVYSRIENEKLFNDIKKFEGDVKEKMFANDDQRTLEKLSRHVDTLLGLANIKLLNGDFDYYKAHKEEFEHEVFSSFINKMATRYGFAYEVDAPSEAVIESMPKLEDFYAIAIKRDKALVDNTIKAMNKENARISVLVTGGFHSEGIAKLLEKRDISYIVVCPNITKDVETPYIRILTNQRTPLEDILSDSALTADVKNVSEGMLAPYLLTAMEIHGDELGELFTKRGKDRIEKFFNMEINRWLQNEKVREEARKMGINLTPEVIAIYFNRAADKALKEYLTNLNPGPKEAKIRKAQTERLKKSALPVITKLLATQGGVGAIRMNGATVKDLQNIAGIPASLNMVTGELTLGEGVVSEPRWSRPLKDAGNSIMNPAVIKSNPDREVYYGFRSARLSEDTKNIDSRHLRFDITVLRPGLIDEKLDREFIMTKGHIHPTLNYPEFYEVWNGLALYVQQGINPNTKKFEFLVTLAKPGDKVLLLPGYSHRTVNIGNEPLVMANWISDRVGGKEGYNIPGMVKPDFSEIEEKNGYAYHVLFRDGLLEFRPNPSYEDNPAGIIFATSWPNIKALGISNKRSMYELNDSGPLSCYLNGVPREIVQGVYEGLVLTPPFDFLNEQDFYKAVAAAREPGVGAIYSEGDGSSEQGALTIDGTGLTAGQKLEVNGKIRADFESGKAKLVERVNGIDIYEIPGLEEVTYLVAHPGRGGDVCDHTKQRIYLSPSKVKIYKNLSVNCKEQFLNHENTHLKNPRLSEDVIEVLAPSHDVRLEILTRGMNARQEKAIGNVYEDVYKKVTEDGKEYTPETVASEYKISPDIAVALLDKVSEESGYNTLKREMYQSVINNTPDAIKDKPLLDTSKKGKITIKFTKENLGDFDPVTNPRGMNLKSWLAKYKKEASASTAGIRGVQNILFPNDPRELIGQKAIILATVAKALVARSLYPDKEIHKFASSEVRFNSREYVEFIARIQAALGIRTHMQLDAATSPIWMASFLIFKYDMMGGEYVTSSHAISKKIATKDLNSEGSQYIPDESKLFVDKIEEIIKQIEEKGEYPITLAAIDDESIDQDFMKKINNGIDDYVRYLKAGIATPDNIELIKKGKNKIFIDVVGGCMYRTMSKIFEKLGIFDRLNWLHTKEDPYFHGIGKSCYRLNTENGKLGFEDLSCDTSIVAINSRKDVEIVKKFISDFRDNIAKKSVGSQILIPVPGSNSKIFGQIRLGSDPELDLLSQSRVINIPLDKEKILVFETDNRILPVIRTMGYKRSLKNAPIGTVIELTDPDGDRLITAQIVDISNRDKLEKLGLAYEILDSRRVLVVFMPNQSFLMTIDFRKQMLKRDGEWSKRNWFMIKTTASAAAWDDWAAAQSDKSYKIKYAGTDKWVDAKGVPVINGPVGFKEIASIMKKAEKQMREAPDKDVIIEDIFGNQINLGVQPRLLFAGEESGGEIFGPTEMIESTNGRKAIAMREKSAGEAMVITSAMAADLEAKGITLVDYLIDIFDENKIVNRFDYREDIIYFNESEPDINIRKKAEAEGLKMKEENDFFFLAIAIALRDGKITFDQALTFLKKTFPSIDFKELKGIYFVGDGVYLKFTDRVVEIRPSGTEAKTKGYAMGASPKMLVNDAKALAGYYSEDMRDQLIELLSAETQAAYFKEAEFMGTKMPAVKVRSMEIYNAYLAKGAETAPFVPPADYKYLYIPVSIKLEAEAANEVTRNGTFVMPALDEATKNSIKVETPVNYKASADIAKRVPAIVKTMATQTGVWATSQFVDAGKTMLGWMRLAAWRNGPMKEMMKGMRAYVNQLLDECKRGGATDVYFIGQGGSVECIKTLLAVFGNLGGLKVHIVDSTDQEFIADLVGKVDCRTARFVILSKSMTTAEVHSGYKLFFAEAMKQLGNREEAVKRFTLVTDEGKASFKDGALQVVETVRSPFRQEVLDRGFQNVFYIQPETGGRFTWDTAVGILPAMIMGHDIEELLKGAEMIEALSKNPNFTENPAVQYGVFKYMMQLEGRKRPTLILPEELKGYGPWYGQLDTESLGKTKEMSSVVIDHEKLASDTAEYTQKRFFVRMKLGENDNRFDAEVAKLEAAGLPVFTITLPNSSANNVSARDFGALLKMSEFATAIAGYLMGINPVNQPGVEAYKKAQDRYLKEGPSKENPAYVVEQGNIKLNYEAAIGKNGISEDRLKEVLQKTGSNTPAAKYAALLHLAAKEKGRDYAVMMMFKKLSTELAVSMDKWRYGVRGSLHIDTLSEEAPCILHAKQQGFQQGENSGFFTVVRFAEYGKVKVVIPGSKEAYGAERTFEDLIKAQAAGTLAALSEAGQLGVMIELKDTGSSSVADFGNFISEVNDNLQKFAKPVSEISKSESVETKDMFDHTVATIMQSSDTGERVRDMAVEKFKETGEKHLIFVKSAIPEVQLSTTTIINLANICETYYNEVNGYTAHIVDSYEKAVELLSKNPNWDKTNTIVGLVDTKDLEAMSKSLESSNMKDKTKLLAMEKFSEDQLVPIKGFFDLMSVMVRINRPLDKAGDSELIGELRRLLDEIGIKDVNKLVDALSAGAYFEDPLKFAKNFIIRLLPPTKPYNTKGMKSLYDAAIEVVKSL